MINTESYHNTILLAARLAQARPDVLPYSIARNLGKLQKLAVSLHARYSEGATNDLLEEHAKALGQEIKVTVRPTRKARGNALAIGIDGAEYGIF